MTLFREHRGSLHSSITTVRDVADYAYLVQLLADAMRPYGFEVHPDMVEVKPYGRDDRIGWDTHVVQIAGYGVAGFTNGPIV